MLACADTAATPPGPLSVQTLQPARRKEIESDPQESYNLRWNASCMQVRAATYGPVEGEDWLVSNGRPALYWHRFGHDASLTLDHQVLA